MKSTQDRIPSYRLGNELALDAQGRVLRRPHFLTMREHQDAMRMEAANWAGAVEVEKRKTRSLAEMKIDNIVVIHPRIFCRSKLQWLVKLCITIE